MNFMENIFQILKKKTIQKNKNIHSEAHYLADTISRVFGERKKFAMYLGIIKRIGAAEARRIFAEIRDSDCQNPAKLFLWKARKNNLTVLSNQFSNKKSSLSSEK